MTRPAGKQRSAMTNGTRMFIEALPGNGIEARRFRDLVRALMDERGGADALTVRKREACRTYAGLILMRDKLNLAQAKGEPVDPEALGQIGDRIARAGREMGPEVKPAKLTAREHAERYRAGRGTP